MTKNLRSPSRRRQEIRTWWAEHLTAQRGSGQSQAAYCRARGLDAKYFTLWKRKLRERPGACAARMVPVVVKATPAAPATTLTSTPTAVSLRLALGNGLTVSLEISVGALPAVVRGLAAL